MIIYPEQDKKHGLMNNHIWYFYPTGMLKNI